MTRSSYFSAVEADGSTRALAEYEGTLRVRPIVEGDRSFVEWSTSYECRPEDDGFWADWWARSLPTWVGSLRDHLDRRPGD